MQNVNVDGKNNEELFLPSEIFTRELSSLEAITKYMKENLGMKFCEIAALLGRDDRTIWGAYDSSKVKLAAPFVLAGEGVTIPILLLRSRQYSVLETITLYLKEAYNMKYSEIARLTQRNDRTIWTVYKRAKQKGVSAK